MMAMLTINMGQIFPNIIKHLCPRHLCPKQAKFTGILEQTNPHSEVFWFWGHNAHPLHSPHWDLYPTWPQIRVMLWPLSIKVKCQLFQSWSQGYYSCRLTRGYQFNHFPSGASNQVLIECKQCFMTTFMHTGPGKNGTKWSIWLLCNKCISDTNHA
jgi:hypothetical protein